MRLTAAVRRFFSVASWGATWFARASVHSSFSDATLKSGYPACLLPGDFLIVTSYRLALALPLLLVLVSETWAQGTQPNATQGPAPAAPQQAAKPTRHR